MSKMKVFCFGFGQVAKYFAKKILKEKIALELNVTSRKNTHKLTFEGLDFNFFKFNNKKIDKNIDTKVQDADFVLVSIPPVEDEDIVLKNFKEILKKSNPKWITYLSATSVYGNHDGEWVNEESGQPTSTSGIKRLQAENQWLKFSSDNNLPLQIFRLSGIYSIQNNILKINFCQAKIVKRKIIFSRIHVENLANLYFAHKNSKVLKSIIFQMTNRLQELASYGSKLKSKSELLN